MSQSVSLNLMVHHLRFTLQARTLVHLGPQAGAQIRGALWAALEKFACTDPQAQSRRDHSHHCPMCRLVALETAEGMRGVNPPRPFAIQPPLGHDAQEDRRYQSGERFTLGISLFGDAADLFPYICKAVYDVGDIGVGYGRGQFTLVGIEAFDPLTGQKQDLFQGGRITASPALPITQDQISRAVSTIGSNSLQLHFLTPTQLTGEQGRMASTPDFPRLVSRLLERCQAMETHYTPQPASTETWRERYLSLTTQAQSIQQVRCDTRWVNIRSGSRRSNTTTSVGGFVGKAVYEGDLSPFLPWLLWGQSLHVGKNAVKGNGWYTILSA
jgi:hypothetical protein